MHTSRFATLSRDELAVLVPELLLVGHLIDRAGMAWCISAFGREEMLQIAIEEWSGASPIYTRRIQRALGFAPEVEGQGDVVTIFKGLQLDIGAPPQFLDFRYTVHDPHHGEFQLDHCGALMDVEPMGEDYVVGMCHDIEDPTFDATAIATHSRAQVRPIHRPPRAPANRQPHCAWSVIIDDSHPEAQPTPALAINARSRAATLELPEIDRDDDGASDYAGPLVSDLDFAAFSRSALIRLADEVCLQMALLDNSFAVAVAKRATAGETLAIRRKQFTGIAGLGAYRIARALDVSHDAAGALRLLTLHPALNPSAYVTAELHGDAIVVRPGPVHDDQGWIALCGPEWADALRAIVRVLDPHLDVAITALGDGWQLRVIERDEPAPEAQEVAIAKFSTGTDFSFEKRRSLTIVPV
ncbi:MAG TPA: hypothetical protein VK948_08715 [Aeromicrobium sp.]|nr:hypothetical protein [Aeromicrobium sp.]